MEAAFESTLSGVETELETLEARGARAYDGPACDAVHALLSHAEQLGGEVGTRLRGRAGAHLQALSERFERDGRRVAVALEDAEQTHGELPELRQRLQNGELISVARSLRKLRAGMLRSPGRRPASTGARVALGRVAEADAQGRAERRRRLVAYEDSVAQLVASFALARATDGVPTDAGPYNPLRIASEVLDRMRAISPFYLTVQLNRLEELASLLSLPELPTPAVEKVLPKRKPKAQKRGA